MKRLIAVIIVLLVAAGPVFSQKKDTYRVRTVVIDPGHGGAKPGAQGKQSQEKTITLSVAKKFGKLLEDNYPDVKVIYTRTTDVDISLAERAHIANRNKADLFISIHANSHPTSAPTGVETFVMGLSESRANLEVAKKENADILLESDYKNNSDYSGFDPNAPETYVMLTMFQNSFIDKSLNLAEAIQNQYKQNLKTINRGVKQAELYVLYKTTCPSVLTEVGFISNPAEEAFMLSDEGQAKIAVSLFNAFMTYKATEEGTDKIKNPVINIKGWNQEGSKETKAEPKKEAPVAEAPQTVVKEEEKPVVKEEENVVAETKEEVLRPEDAPVVEVTPKPVAPAEKPTPSATLPAVQQPAPAPQPTPAPQQPAPAAKPAARTNLQAPVHTASANAESYFTVQFLIHPTLLKAGHRDLGDVSDFMVENRDGKYIYTTGRFATLKDATLYCSHLKQATQFKDAWVTQRKNTVAAATPQPEQSAKPAQPTQPAQTAQATQPAQPAPAAAPATPKEQQPAARKSGVTYRVQFCTATRVMKAGDPDLHGITDFHIAPSGKFYLYTAGDYSTLQEARQRLQRIKNTTRFRDAFVIALYNGERITLERAAQIEKQKK